MTPNNNQFDLTSFLENFTHQNSSKNAQIVNKEQIKKILNNIDVNDPNTTINSSVIINGSNQNIQEQLMNLKSKLGSKFDLVEKFLPPDIRQQLQNLGGFSASSSSISGLPPSQISNSSPQDLNQFNTSSGLPPSQISPTFLSQEFNYSNTFERNKVDNNKRFIVFIILVIISFFVGFAISNNYDRLKNITGFDLKKLINIIK